MPPSIPHPFALAIALALAAGLLLAAGAALAEPVPAMRDSPLIPEPPPTPRRTVEDRYHGTVVAEDYRWLEAAGAPEVEGWSEAQNARARAYLDGLPDRPAILARVEELSRTMAPEYADLEVRGGRFFALKEEPPKQQPFLVVRESLEPDAAERVIVDPNTLDPSGDTAIDFFEPSLDGALVAVSLSQGGTEDGTVSVFVTATGERLPDRVPRVNGGTAGGSVAWTAGNQGFFRTRYPSPGERPESDLAFYEQVCYHELGSPASADTYSLGRGLPRIAEIFLESTGDGRYVLANVLNGDGGEHAFWLRGPGGDWTQVTRFEDGCVKARFGVGADRGLYLLSYQEALNGKILRLGLEEPDLARARVVVPEGETAISSFTPARSLLYVRDVIGGPSRVRLVHLDGSAAGAVPLPPLTAVEDMVHIEGDEVVLQRESYTEPEGWYRFDPARGVLEPTALLKRSTADFSGVEVRRTMATSKDGTGVPVNILMLKGTRLDGTAPLLLYGYGGYGVTLAPDFRAERLAWIEQGGIWAVANLRGGGEFGEGWHRAGMLTRKQNVFDDFAAAAEHLIGERYTSRERLAAMGGSNGGLLMGAALVQHPDLFRAVVSRVGIYDMLRVELHPNGEFNTTEFGTVKKRDEFEALHAYSPYHGVEDGAAYPAVLFMTGANDPRVDPMHSRKMTARLQAASSSGRPVLLRTSATTGHGGRSPLSARVEERADALAFLFAELRIPYRAAAGTSAER